MNERLMLQKLERTQGVLRLLGWSQASTSMFTIAQPKFLVLKYYQYGDLFQYILGGLGAFNEEVCRYIFIQILGGIITQFHVI